MKGDDFSRNTRRRIRMRVLIAGAVVYLIACTALILRIGFAPAAPKYPPGSTRTRAGQIAPRFRITTTDGRVFDSATPRDGLLVVTFFATWCGPCAQELSRLQTEIHRRRSGRHATVLAISIDDGDAAIKAYWSQKGLTLPAASDAGRSVFTQFAATGIPRTYLIDSTGHIVYQMLGYTERDFPRLVNALNAAPARAL